MLASVRYFRYIRFFAKLLLLVTLLSSIGLALGRPMAVGDETGSGATEVVVGDLGDLESRISFGYAAPDGAYPFFSRLVITDGDGNRWGCGGSLIAPDWVLTAAHCAIDDSGKLNPRKIEVFVKGSPGGLTGSPVLARGFYAPSKWSSRGSTLSGDILLVKLSSPVEGVQPVTISGSLPKAGSNLIIMGLGQTESSRAVGEDPVAPASLTSTDEEVEWDAESESYEGDGYYGAIEDEVARDLVLDAPEADNVRPKPMLIKNAGRRLTWDKLLVGNMPIMSKKQALNYLKGARIGNGIESDHFAAGLGPGAMDTCIGDSGGPVLTKSGELVGIVSYGYTPCGDPKPVNFFTDATQYRSWSGATLKRSINVRRLFKLLPEY